MPIYIVRFEPDELWGEVAEQGAGPLYAELFEAYLTAADADASSGSIVERAEVLTS